MRAPPSVRMTTSIGRSSRSANSRPVNGWLPFASKTQKAASTNDVRANQANEQIQKLLAAFSEDEEDKKIYGRTFGSREVDVCYYYRIVEILTKYQTNTDHAWLTLFYAAAASNCQGRRKESPKKGVSWLHDDFVINQFAIQRKLGIDNQIWTQAYCQQISPFVDPKWKIGDTYEVAARKGTLLSQTPKFYDTGEAASIAAAREASGLHHYRMMGVGPTGKYDFR